MDVQYGEEEQGKNEPEIVMPSIDPEEKARLVREASAIARDMTRVNLVVAPSEIDTFNQLPRAIRSDGGYVMGIEEFLGLMKIFEGNLVTVPDLWQVPTMLGLIYYLIIDNFTYERFRNEFKGTKKIGKVEEGGKRIMYGPRPLVQNEIAKTSAVLKILKEAYGENPDVRKNPSEYEKVKVGQKMFAIIRENEKKIIENFLISLGFGDYILYDENEILYLGVDRVIANPIELLRGLERTRGLFQQELDYYYRMISSTSLNNDLEQLDREGIPLNELCRIIRDYGGKILEIQYTRAQFERCVDIYNEIQIKLYVAILNLMVKKGNVNYILLGNTLNEQDKMRLKALTDLIVPGESLDKEMMWMTQDYINSFCNLMVRRSTFVTGEYELLMRAPTISLIPESVVLQIVNELIRNGEITTEINASDLITIATRLGNEFGIDVTVEPGPGDSLRLVVIAKSKVERKVNESQSALEKILDLTREVKDQPLWRKTYSDVRKKSKEAGISRKQKEIEEAKTLVAVAQGDIAAALRSPIYDRIIGDIQVEVPMGVLAKGDVILGSTTNKLPENFREIITNIGNYLDVNNLEEFDERAIAIKNLLNRDPRLAKFPKNIKDAVDANIDDQRRILIEQQELDAQIKELEDYNPDIELEQFAEECARVSQEGAGYLASLREILSNAKANYYNYPVNRVLDEWRAIRTILNIQYQSYIGDKFVEVSGIFSNLSGNYVAYLYDNITASNVYSAGISVLLASPVLLSLIHI
jgi:hypothetical protein